MVGAELMEVDGADENLLFFWSAEQDYCNISGGKYIDKYSEIAWFNIGAFDTIYEIYEGKVQLKELRLLEELLYDIFSFI